MNKKKLTILIVGILIIASATFGSYALWRWTGSVNKGVVFNTSKKLQEYIEYDAGESKFIGNLQVGSTYLDGIHSTISVKKDSAAENITVVGTIHMDINAIGTNMQSSSALKWAVTSGNSTNPGDVLADGNFVGTSAGDMLTLLQTFEITTTKEEYTIWIWLDENENPASELAGETLDTNVWTEINQIEGIGETFDITMLNVKYQVVNATVVNSKSVINGYAITDSNTEPSSWTSIDSADQKYVYSLQNYVNDTGTYYVWFKAANGSTTSRAFNVTQLDSTGPVCSFDDFSKAKIQSGETATINLTCTDPEVGMKNTNLSTSDLTLSDDALLLRTVSRSTVPNGYKYTITAIGTSTRGNVTITLPSNKLKNVLNMDNESVTSGSIFVRNPIDISDATVTLEYNTTVYDGTEKEPTITVVKDSTLTKDTDYTVTYENNLNAGTATITITGIDDYEGTITRTFEVTRKPITVPTCESKTYNGNEQTLFVAHTGGQYTNGVLKGTNATTYTVEVTPTSNYQWTDETISAKEVTCAINKKVLSATVTANNKVYDGGTSATCNVVLSGIIEGDTVTADATGTFDNKNVGENKTVTCSNIVLSGASASNYSASAAVNTATANITKYKPEINLSAPSRNVNLNTEDTFNVTTTTIAACSGTLTAESADTNYVTVLSDSSTVIANNGTITTVRYKAIKYTTGKNINVSYTSNDTSNCDTTDSKTFAVSVIDNQAPTITLSSNSDNAWMKQRSITVTIEDLVSGLAEVSNIKYGWSTSNSTEPTSYTNATLNYETGDDSTTFEATGSGIDGAYYLWVVPVTLEDLAGNSTTSAVISTGTFNFDNDPLTPPTISYESNVVTNGLIYQLDGRNNTGNGHNNSATSWYNFGSSGTNGTISGATWGSNYLQFDGTDDYVNLGLNNSDYITFEAAFSINATKTSRHSILENAGASILVEHTSGNISGAIYVNSTWHQIDSNITAVANTIYHVALTYDGSVATLYVNGVKAGSASVLGTLYSGPSLTVIGCNPNASGCNIDSALYHGLINGKIYSARVYNRALSQQEVRQNYNMDKLSVGNYANGHPTFKLTGGTSTIGISKTQYKLNEDSWTDYDSANLPTVSTDGENSLYGHIINTRGAVGESSADTVYIDNVAPTATLSVEDNDFAITATVTASDDDSGLSSVYGYKLSTSSTCDSTTTGFVEVENSTYTFNVTSSGNYMCVRFEDNAGNYSYIGQEVSSYFVYTGDSQEFTATHTGYYKVEAWGAQGGTYSSYTGGKGGYTSGYIYLTENEKLYIYVGGQGKAATSQTATAIAGGYNGGGNAYGATDKYVTGGGGASDVRLAGGDWSDATSLNSRIMVAAGGGGSAFQSSTNYGYGGAGGGLIGVTGTVVGTNYLGQGGTQTAGGAAGYASSATVSGFGQGGGSTTNGTAGGSGYYGGGSGRWYNGGGGGSSFISGYAGVNAIDSSRTHTNNTLHYSNKYFIDGTMTAGTNSGNGKAKITYVDDAPERVNTKLNNVRYIKDCINGNNVNNSNTWEEIQAIQNGINVAKGKNVTSTGTILVQQGTNYNLQAATNGIIDDYNASDVYLNETGLQCITVDLDSTDTGITYNLDEIAVWHVNGRTYNNNVTYVSSNGTDWIPVMADQGAETSQGKRVNAWETKNIDLTTALAIDYAYTGNYQTFNVPISGYYKVETWGAEGGTANSSYIAGKGGYSSGYIQLNANDKLYVYVGGAGAVTSNAANQTAVGGYNGGGSGHNNSSGTGRIAGSGGGATDIRLVSGAWNDATSLNSRIMVAGGGGGSWYNSTAYYGRGGNGGTLIGSSATGNNNGTTVTATGGTQIATTFGIGASGGTSERPGGGGGYYGGNNVAFTSGGGSSFISGYAGVNAITSSSDRTHTNNTLHYSSKYFIKNTMTAGNKGNGKAKIIYVGSEPTRINTSLNNVRYIKDCMYGNGSDNTNRWQEIQAIKNGVNIAKGLTAYSDDGSTLSNASYVTNGDIGTEGGSDAYGSARCIIVDLDSTDTGVLYDLDEIAVWHNWQSVYATTKSPVTYVSSDGSNWNIVIMNNSAETSHGKRINAWNVPPMPTVTASVDSSYHINGILENFLNSVSAYCVNTSATDTSGCTWVSHSSTSITTSVISDDGTYYLHVKDSKNNIFHSNSVKVSHVPTAADFSYTGSMQFVSQGGNNWYIKLKTGGTLTVTKDMNVDVFLVGGGGGGSQAYNNISILASSGGAGGGGGNRTTKTSITLSQGTSYVATIGAGGNGGSGSYQADGRTGGTTSLTNCSGCSATGGTGATDYNKPGSGGATGGKGMYAYGSVTQATSGGNGAYAFGDSSLDGIRYGAGGGGGGDTYRNAGSGGTTGGGLGGGKNSSGTRTTGAAGTVNTGSGGGGGSADSYSSSGNLGYVGGTGGTGIIIIRNHR